MAFHRLTVPSYTGGLPGGYNYINNAVSGTPADADGALSGGPNSGSYFVGFGDDARSRNANRPVKALAENCDYLDDLLRRDIATTAIQTGTASGDTSSVIVTGPGIYLGPSGTPNTTAGIETVFQVLDSNDREIVNTGSECKVTAIAGGTIGSGGFSSGNVTLTVSPAIPDTTSYKVVYGTRTNLATLPIDALTNIRIRGAQEVPGELIGFGGAALIGYNGGPNWLDTTTNPQATVEAQLDKIITDLVATAGAARVGTAILSGFTNGDTVAAGSVQSALTGIVAALGNAAGSNRVGSAALSDWLDTTAVGAGSILSQLNAIVTGLGATSGTGGTGKIGAPSAAASFSGAPWTLAADDLTTQLSQLLSIDNAPFRVRSYNASAAIDNGGIRDSIIILTATSISITLPAPASNAGRVITFIDKSGLVTPTSFVTLVRNGSEMINGLVSNYRLQATGGRWVLVCDGTDWYTL